MQGRIVPFGYSDPMNTTYVFSIGSAFPSTAMAKRGKAKMNVSLNTVYNPFHGPANLPISPHETKEEWTRREREFQDAQRISCEIDEQLLKTKKMLQRRRRAIKMLLLGESNSSIATIISRRSCCILAQGEAESGKVGYPLFLEDGFRLTFLL